MVPVTSPLQGFDQIVAVSQDQINLSLDVRFSDENLLQWEVKNKNIGKMTAHMLPPTVALFILDEPAKTRFSLHFDSGTFTYYTLTDDDPPQVKSIPVDVTNWTLTFTANLSLDAIHKLPDDLAKKIAFPGSYSVSQLLFNFTTADLVSFDRDLSSTPGITKPLGADSVRDDALSRLISMYLRDQVQAPGHNVLGYAITVPDPAKTNPTAPSFPPTSVRFQTMAHQPSAPGSDCILFLEMTGNHQFPTQPYIGWTWNWISEEKLDSRHAGCMVLSKENFWDKFFVPHATILNRFTLEMVAAIWVFCVGDQFVAFPVPGLDPNQVPDSKLGWTTSSTRKSTYSWDAEYKDSITTREAHATVDVDFDTAAKTIRTSSKCILSVEDVVFESGPNREDFRKTVSANVTWSFAFTLNDVANGGLGLSIAAETPAVTIKAVLTIGDKPDDADSDYEDKLRRAVEQMVSGSAPGLEWAVDNAFNHQSQFVFPGSGTFFMKDPTFNESGDIVVGLVYQQE
ncbi:hypothetical protein C8R45DRAFT_929058 [Mycena sanguinolenta]|nr:hypothetical protein C8R45DRAFT_929058 [Mycena sanguinolenta]